MATLKQRLHRKNSSGTYDTVHLETSSSLVVRPSGNTVEADLAAYLPKVQNSDTVPESLTSGQLLIGQTKLWFGDINNKPVEVFIMGQSIDIGNIGTISGMTVDEILNGMVRRKIGIDLGSTGVYVPSYDYVDGAIALGSVVTMGGYEWIVCHLDYTGAAVYLITKDVISTTQFGSSNAYSRSTAASVAKTFENNLDSSVTDNLLTRTVLGVTQKVHLPTYDQMNGGFGYFTTNDLRVAYLNGAAQTYWTASPTGSSRVYYVATDGTLNDYYPSTASGFRPCVALPM